MAEVMLGFFRSWSIVVVLAVLSFSRAALAVEEKCSGPEVCCPDHQVESLDHVVEVKPGVVLLGISNVSEKSGTWDADFYLYEQWPPTPGFTPRTEVVNEVVRTSVSFDDTDLRDGVCNRSRRIHATLRSEFNLRTFPFDKQLLTLRLSDNEFDSKSVVYATKPWSRGGTSSASRRSSNHVPRSNGKPARRRTTTRSSPSPCSAMSRST